MSSPADALREYLIDLGVISRQYDPANPPGSDEWSSVVGRLPPGEDYPDRYVSIMDTGARAYATNMRDNDTAQHPNVSFNVRDVDYDAALAKAQEIEAAMKAVGVDMPDGNSMVQVATEDGVDWVVRSVAVVTPAMYVGQQEQNRREVFSVNFRVDLERVTPTSYRSVYPSAIASSTDYLIGIHGGHTVIFPMISVPGGGGGEVPASRTITAGSNLVGGGDLSADRTLALSPTPSVTSLTASGAVTAASFVGSGAALTGLTASLLSDFAVAARNATIGQRVVYLSRIPGMVFDADPVAGTGTDNTARVQAAVNGGKIRVINDGGRCLIDNVVLDPVTTVECLSCSPDFMFYRKGAPNSGLPPFTNRNWVSGPDAPTDHSISFVNFWANGNRLHYGSGNDGSNPALTDPFYRAVTNLVGTYVPFIALYGVKNFLLQNVHLEDTPSFGVHLANCRDGYIHNYGKWRRFGDSVSSDDILHVNGHCYRLHAYGLFGTANDDGLALNPNEGTELPGPQLTGFFGGVTPGNIEDSTFNCLHFGDGAGGGVQQAVRFLAVTKKIKNVRIRNVRATIGRTDGSFDYGFSAFGIDNFNIPGDLSLGGLEDVFVDDALIDGYQTGPGPYTSALVFIDRANIIRVEFTNVRGATYGSPPAPLLYVSPNALITEKLIFRDGKNRTVQPGVPAVVLAGTGREVVIENLEHDIAMMAPNPFVGDGSTVLPTNHFVDTGAVLVTGNFTWIKVIGGTVAGLANVVRCVGAAPRVLTVDGVDHRASKGGAMVKSDTPIPRLIVNPTDADHLAEIPDGGGTKLGGFPWYETLFCRDMLAGTADAPLAARVPDFGAAWQADLVGADGFELTGDGWLRPGAASFNAFGTQPADEPNPVDIYEVEFDVKRDAAISAGAYVSVVLAATSRSDLTEVYELRFAGTTISIADATGPLQFTALLPALPSGPTPAEVWRLRAAVYREGDDWRVDGAVSKDAGRTWDAMFPTAYFTSALAPLAAVRSVGSAAGHKIGPITLRSYSQPPPAEETVPTDPGALLSALPGFQDYWEAGSRVYSDTGATVPAVHDDPVAACVGFAGRVAVQATLGARPILDASVPPAMVFDGADDLLAVAAWVAADDIDTHTLAIRYKIVSIAAGSHFFACKGDTGDAALAWGYGAAGYTSTFARAVYGTISPNEDTTTRHLIVHQRAGAGTDTRRRDGADDVGTVANSVTIGSTAGKPFVIGGIGTAYPGAGCNIRIEAIALFTAKLTGADLATLESVMSA